LPVLAAKTAGRSLADSGSAHFLRILLPEHNNQEGFRMPTGKGLIALMGSGELTATMVEVHKALLGRMTASPRAVFLDTPAGFQLNVDQISQKARDYFKTRIGQSLLIASFKSHDTISPSKPSRPIKRCGMPILF
jgi:hypothetical protein